MRSTLALFAKYAKEAEAEAASVGVCDGSNLVFLFQQSKKPTKITKLNKSFCVLASVLSRAHVFMGQAYMPGLCFVCKHITRDVASQNLWSGGDVPYIASCRGGRPGRPHNSRRRMKENE